VVQARSGRADLQPLERLARHRTCGRLAGAAGRAVVSTRPTSVATSPHGLSHHLSDQVSLPRNANASSTAGSDRLSTGRGPRRHLSAGRR
jgi:hypothetical protein